MKRTKYMDWDCRRFQKTWQSFIFQCTLQNGLYGGHKDLVCTELLLKIKGYFNIATCLAKRIVHNWLITQGRLWSDPWKEARKVFAKIWKEVDFQRGREEKTSLFDVSTPSRRVKKCLSFRTHISVRKIFALGYARFFFMPLKILLKYLANTWKKSLTFTIWI